MTRPIARSARSRVACRRGRRSAAFALVATVLASGCSGPALETRPAASHAPAMRRVEPTNTAGYTRNAGTPTLPTSDPEHDWWSIVVADQRVPTQLRNIVRACSPHPARCGVRIVGTAEATGDATPEHVLRIDDDLAPAGDLIYRETDGELRLIYAHNGPDATTTIRDGNVVLTRAMYKPDDDEQAPSGPAEITTYRWNGESLVVVARTGGGGGFSPFMINDEVVV